MSSLNLENYVLDIQNRDWAQLLSKWSWLLTRPFVVRLANRFGDLFLAWEDGSIHFLDLGSGELRPLAANEDELEAKLQTPGQADEWFLISLVDDLVAAGLTPGKDQCYGYRMLPVFGGEYAPDNVVLRDLAAQYAALGPLHEQIKDLPDGAQVTINIGG